MAILGVCKAEHCIRSREEDTLIAVERHFVVFTAHPD